MEISTAEAEHIVAQGIEDGVRLGLDGKLDAVRHIVETTIDRVEAALQERHDNEVEDARRSPKDSGISLTITPAVLDRVLQGWMMLEKKKDARHAERMGLVERLIDLGQPLIERLVKDATDPKPNGRYHAPPEDAGG